MLVGLQGTEIHGRKELVVIVFVCVYVCVCVQEDMHMYVIVCVFMYGCLFFCGFVSILCLQELLGPRWHIGSR